jgi:hypothetical protein
VAHRTPSCEKVFFSPKWLILFVKDQSGGAFFRLKNSDAPPVGAVFGPV